MLVGHLTSPTGGEEDGEEADAYHREEGDDEIYHTHGDGEGGDDEVVAHLDKAELLLQEAYNEADKEADSHTEGGDHEAFYAEGATDAGRQHAKAAEGGDVLAFVDNKEREGGQEVEGGDEDDEGEDEVYAEAFGAEDFIV